MRRSGSPSDAGVGSKQNRFEGLGFRCFRHDLAFYTLHTKNAGEFGKPEPVFFCPSSGRRIFACSGSKKAVTVPRLLGGLTPHPTFRNLIWPVEGRRSGRWKNRRPWEI